VEVVRRVVNLQQYCVCNFRAAAKGVASETLLGFGAVGGLRRWRLTRFILTRFLDL